MRVLFLILASGFFSGCSALPLSFTTKKIMKVHQGMSSKVILEMFGTPKSVSQAVCGPDADNHWNCTTWEYGSSPFDSASFTFRGDNPDSLILNNFTVNRH